jgi:molybdopterin converting factor small subunit
MKLRVLLFASYADAFGNSAIEVELPAASTVRDLVNELLRRAGSHVIPPRPLVAVNAEYAEAGQQLLPTDEVAVIPPVAGG